MTTSKPPWRSTVSCPLNPRALPGRLPFPGPWHARTPRNASCTDFRLRDRRSLHLHRSRAARRRAVRGGDSRGRRRTAKCRGASLPNVIHWGWRGAPAPSNPDRGKLSTTTARASPSESADLRWSNACTTCLRHPPPCKGATHTTARAWTPGAGNRRSFRGLWRPGFFCSRWTIVSMTTSKPPWPSTVSLAPESASFAGGRLRFPGAWHTRTPRNASCTDFPLRDRRSRRLRGNRNGRLAQRPCGRDSVLANRPDTATKSQRNPIFSQGHNGGQDALWKSLSPLYKMRYINDR